MTKRIMAFLLSGMVAAGLSGCAGGGSKSADTDSSAVSSSAVSEADSSSTDDGATVLSDRSSILMSLDENGALSIERPSRDETVPMGEDDTWTIFVYVCGSDLESTDGSATDDISEMFEADTSDNVRYVVQAGGASEWMSNIDSTKSTRLVIQGGEADEIENDDVNMGESSSLADFLSWGIENYSAANMGLIFWNHGSGSIDGVCFDENHDEDSLTLRDIDAALLSVYDSMTDNFRFIGFDACLMSTLETANVCASYADYMYANEETESGYGWNYTEIGNYISENPGTDPASLGKVVADSYNEESKQGGDEKYTSFCITDLSKTDDVIIAFNNYAKNLYEATGDGEVLAQFMRNAMSLELFGSHSDAEGYSNMADLASVIRAGQGFADGADEALSAIENAQAYKLFGSMHEGRACGISVYYPVQIQGSTELSTFTRVAVSPYYLAFVDRMAYSSANDGSGDGFDESSVIDGWGDYAYTVSEDGYFDPDGADTAEEFDYWQQYDEISDYESELITFEAEPYMTEDGYYVFKLDEAGLEYTAGVSSNVCMLSDDGADYIDLGSITNANIDWETGEGQDDFDGYWFALPNGAPLSVSLVEECDGYDIYTSPVLLNGEETNLRITDDYQNGVITIDGALDSISEGGAAGRGLKQLADGDEITPCYSAISVDLNEESEYYGDSYTYDGNPEIQYELLPDGEYIYGFMFTDVYGATFWSVYVNYTIEGDTIYYE